MVVCYDSFRAKRSPHAQSSVVHPFWIRVSKVFNFVVICWSTLCCHCIIRELAQIKHCEPKYIHTRRGWIWKFGLIEPLPHWCQHLWEHIIDRVHCTPILKTWRHITFCNQRPWLMKYQPPHKDQVDWCLSASACHCIMLTSNLHLQALVGGRIMGEKDRAIYRNSDLLWLSIVWLDHLSFLQQSMWCYWQSPPSSPFFCCKVN